MKRRLLYLLAAMLSSFCPAEIYTVALDGSGDFVSIQEAIFEAWHGDTIVVKPGQYEEDFRFGGRAITVTSEDPEDPDVVSATIINGTISFEFGEQEQSVLRGFTFLSDTFTIETNTSPQETPHIHGNTIVWKDSRNGNVDIYGLNLTRWELLEICTAEKTQTNPKIHNGLVVWQDFRDSNYDIYAYHVLDSTEYEVSAGTQAEAEPAVYDGMVVWRDNRSGNTDLYGRDLFGADANEFVVVDHASNQSAPEIYGDIVVWVDDRNGNNDLYGKNIATGQEFEICTDTASQTNPAIYGDIVVWQDNRNGNFDIYGRQVPGGTEFAICTNTGSQLYPSIYGNRVVWEDLRNGNSDIYGWDLTEEIELEVFIRRDNQMAPAIGENLVVWQDNRNGNADIFAHDIRFPQCTRNASVAIICYEASPTVQNNTIQFYEDIGIWGSSENAQPVIQNCSITYNGMGIYGCDGLIESNSVLNNRQYGISSCDAQISDNIIEGNGMAGVFDCNSIEQNLIQLNNGFGISQCQQANENLIAGNTEGGVYAAVKQVKGNIIVNNGGPGLKYCDDLVINNTLVANEIGLEECYGIARNNIIAYHSTAGISGYCDNSYNCFWQNAIDFDETTPGPWNVLVDPKFADMANYDFHLKSKAGRWDMESQQWVYDSQTSRCIDAGDPSDDVGQEPNPNGGRINFGAYGGTSEASKSKSGIVQTVCTDYPEMDFNKDCRVNLADLAIFSEQWLQCNLDPQSACE